MLKESGFRFFRQFFDKSAVKMSDCGLIPIGPIPISKRRIPDVEPVEWIVHLNGHTIVIPTVSRITILMKTSSHLWIWLDMTIVTQDANVIVPISVILVVGSFKNIYGWSTTNDTFIINVSTALWNIRERYWIQYIDILILWMNVMDIYISISVCVSIFISIHIYLYLYLYHSLSLSH